MRADAVGAQPEAGHVPGDARRLAATSSAAPLVGAAAQDARTHPVPTGPASYMQVDGPGAAPASRLARVANRLVLCFVDHWAALVNGMLALTLGLGLLAPWLMLHGHTTAGRLVYLALQPSCHQLPERSFFVGGPRSSYGYQELYQHLGNEPAARYIGDANVGYKMAYCERCTGIYAGWLLAGLAFGLLRRRAKRLSWKGLALLTLPMVIDGVLQFAGILESDWIRRSVTGLLFGVAVIWFAFPLVEPGMQDAHETARRSLEEVDVADG